MKSISMIIVFFGALAASFADGTNQPSPSELNSRGWEKRATYLKELETAQDAVAVIERWSREPAWGFGIETICKELDKHWEDPRSEQILARLARSGPHHADEVDANPPLHAHFALLQVQAKKMIYTLLVDKRTSKDQVAALRTFYNTHSDWFDHFRQTQEQSIIASEALKRVVELDPDGSVDLLVKMKRIMANDYPRKHPRAVIEYARQHGVEGLVEPLAATQDPEAIKLIDAWVAEDKTGERAPIAMGHLIYLPDAKNRLIAFLNDSHPKVVREAANWLAHLYPDEDALSAVKITLERYQQAGVEEELQNILKGVIFRVEDEIRNRKKRGHWGDSSRRTLALAA